MAFGHVDDYAGTCVAVGKSVVVGKFFVPHGVCNCVESVGVEIVCFSRHQQ